MHKMMKEPEQVHIKLTRLAGARGVGFATVSRLADDRAACSRDAVCVHRPSKSANSDGGRAGRYPEHGARRETHEPRWGELEAQLDGAVNRTTKQSPRGCAEGPPSGDPIACRTTTRMYSCGRDPASTI